MEESFFLRIAITGGSAVSIISEAGTTSTCFSLYVYPESSRRMTSSCPVKNTFTWLFSFTASTAPFTISFGAWSPPMASTATFTNSAISPRILPLSGRLTFSYKKRVFHTYIFTILDHITKIKSKLRNPLPPEKQKSNPSGLLCFWRVLPIV